jgi:hypothetical protein
MSIGELACLSLIAAAFLLFMGTLAWASRRDVRHGHQSSARGAGGTAIADGTFGIDAVCDGYPWTVGGSLSMRPASSFSMATTFVSNPSTGQRANAARPASVSA